MGCPKYVLGFVQRIYRLIRTYPAQAKYGAWISAQAINSATKSGNSITIWTKKRYNSGRKMTRKMKARTTMLKLGKDQSLACNTIGQEGWFISSKTVRIWAWHSTTKNWGLVNSFPSFRFNVTVSFSCFILRYFQNVCWRIRRDSSCWRRYLQIIQKTLW